MARITKTQINHVKAKLITEGNARLKTALEAYDAKDKHPKEVSSDQRFKDLLAGKRKFDKQYGDIDQILNKAHNGWNTTFQNLCSMIEYPEREKVEAGIAARKKFEDDLRNSIQKIIDNTIDNIILGDKGIADALAKAIAAIKAV